MATSFQHEKLVVYQEAIALVAWATRFLASVDGRASAKDQLERASTSIPLNIAEGNGKFSVKDRCRFLDIAYASALECAACLDVLVAKELTKRVDVKDGMERLDRIAAMLTGLKNSLASRVAEEHAEYLVNGSDECRIWSERERERES